MLFCLGLSFLSDYLTDDDRRAKEAALLSAVGSEFLTTFVPLMIILNIPFLAMYPLIVHRYGEQTRKLKQWLTKRLSTIDEQGQEQLNKNKDSSEQISSTVADESGHDYVNELYEQSLVEVSQVDPTATWLAYCALQVFVLVFAPYYISKYQLSVIFSLIATQEAVSANTRVNAHSPSNFLHSAES